MNDAYEVIDLVLDGERVDGDVLREALADADARAYFVDGLALLAAVKGLEPAPTVAAARGGVTPAWRWISAAALVAICLGGGYLLGRWSSSQVNADLASGERAPAPTTVIHLEPGVDWKQGSE